MGEFIPVSELDRTKYPGMRQGERDVWRRWLSIYEFNYDRYEYNVRIGVGRDPGPTYSQAIRKMAVLLSQQRADVFAWRGSALTIIEVKKSAWPYAVQQVQTYGAVYALEHSMPIAPALVIVTGRVMEGTAETALLANVALVTV